LNYLLHLVQPEGTENIQFQVAWKLLTTEFFLKINMNVTIYRSQSKNITLIQVLTSSKKEENHKG
jgi:hypothetical protein